MQQFGSFLSSSGLLIAAVVQLYLILVGTFAAVFPSNSTSPSLFLLPSLFRQQEQQPLVAESSRSWNGNNNGKNSRIFLRRTESTGPKRIRDGGGQAASVFTDADELRVAVRRWVDDPASATVEYGGPIGNWDVSRLRDLSGLFQDTVTTVPGGGPGGGGGLSSVSSWDVSNCYNFSSMFRNAKGLGDDLDLSGWRMSRAVDLSHMFESAEDFNGNLSSWSLDSAIDLSYMMKDAASFNGDVGSWLRSSTGGDSSAVYHPAARTIESMFDGAASFEGAGVDQWNTTNVINMKAAFRNAVRFRDASLLADWDVRNVLDFRGMLHGVPDDPFFPPKLLLRSLCAGIDKDAIVIDVSADDDFLDRLGCYYEDDNYSSKDAYYSVDDDSVLHDLEEIKPKNVERGADDVAQRGYSEDVDDLLLSRMESSSDFDFDDFVSEYDSVVEDDDGRDDDGFLWNGADDDADPYVGSGDDGFSSLISSTLGKIFRV